jgi:hypothetical protein
MAIRSLNIHMLMDKRFVSNLVLAEKRRALSELVEYAGKNSVFISHDDNYALTDS